MGKRERRRNSKAKLERKEERRRGKEEGTGRLRRRGRIGSS